MSCFTVSANRLFAKNCSSNSMANGTAVSKLPHRNTGASKYSKQCSIILALISPPNQPYNTSSCKTITLTVLRTVAAIAS